MYSSIRRSIFSYSFSTNLLNKRSLLEPLKIPAANNVKNQETKALASTTYIVFMSFIETRSLLSYQIMMQLVTRSAPLSPLCIAPFYSSYSGESKQHHQDTGSIYSKSLAFPFVFQVLQPYPPEKYKLCWVKQL